MKQTILIKLSDRVTFKFLKFRLPLPGIAIGSEIDYLTVFDLIVSFINAVNEFL